MMLNIMKEYTIPIMAILLIGVSFGFMGQSGHLMNNITVNNSMNSTIMNNTNHSIINNTKGNATVLINKTESGFTKNITTPNGIITVQKTNNSIQITINNTKIENIIQMIKNRGKRAIIIHLLKNENVNNSVKKQVREKIINAMKNSTLRKEILQNKTILKEIVHPRVKSIIDTGIIKNTTIIKNGNSTLISMKVVVHKKILGLFPVNIDEKVLTNDTYYKIKRPWWAIFAI